VTGPDKVTLLHQRMIALSLSGRLEWEKSLDGYLWSSANHSLIVEAESVSFYDDCGRKLFRITHPLTADLFSAAAASQEKRADALIDALIADLDEMSVGA
jgi:hypothetical protein